MASVPTPLYTHMLAWQLDTHSWSWMEPVYVRIMCFFLFHTNVGVKYCHTVLQLTYICNAHSFLYQSFGLMCIQLACYHGVKVLTTSHSQQTHTFLEQLRPSVGMNRPELVSTLTSLLRSLHSTSFHALYPLSTLAYFPYYFLCYFSFLSLFEYFLQVSRTL